MLNWDPFQGDVDLATKAYTTCGKVAIWLGPVELAIEVIVLMLRNRQKAPTQDYAFVDFPVSFARKSDEIKDRLKKDAALFGEIRARTSKLLGEAAQIHRRRTIVCHSRCQGVNLRGELHFTRSDHKRGVSSGPEYLSFQQLDADVKRMRTLALEFEKIATDIRLRGIGFGAPPYVPSNQTQGDPLPTTE